ncbi:MAG: Peptidyl-tRNA hydrolase [Candidatus Pacebacteria bacterium GW2011_GWA1_46_10]|nr:MAG: Peptidyl-tRNA hydrolase [Candidatus Pacebacteria bacterium GW2011_GWA1_46_10]
MIDMKILIGLGNPGREYQRSRHNVGFRVLELLAKKLDITFTDSPRLFSQVGKLNDWLLVKPKTFVNGSGQAVRAVLNFYKLSPAALTVVHDDLDLPFGTWKSQFGTGPKIHNGLLSIYQALGTRDFTHLRIGVDNRAGKRTMLGKDYVLQPFSSQEERELRVVVEEVVKYLLD